MPVQGTGFLRLQSFVFHQVQNEFFADLVQKLSGQAKDGCGRR